MYPILPNRLYSKMDPKDVPKLDIALTKNNNGKLPTFFILGRRGVGKTFLIKDLLWHYREVPQGIVITPSEFDSFYETFLPKQSIYSEYKKDMTVMDNISDSRFMVLDDCLYDGSVFRDESLCECFKNPHLLLAMTLQYPLDIPVRLRDVADYVFIFREPSVSIRLRIYQNYVVNQVIPTFDLFCKIMDKLEEHQCLVIGTATSKLFVYKANPAIFEEEYCCK